MKLGLILVGVTAAASVASVPLVGSRPVAVQAPLAEQQACQADRSLFKTGLPIPTRFKPDHRSAPDHVLVSVEYFCKCKGTASDCGWRSATLLAANR